MWNLREENQYRQRVDEADHDCPGDETHQAANTQVAEPDLEEARQHGRSKEVPRSVFSDQRHDDKRHRSGRGGDHSRTPTGNGDDDGDRERRVEPNLRVDSGDDRKRDRLWD